MNVVKMINSVVYVKLEVLTSVLYSESSECRDLMFYNRNVKLNHSYIFFVYVKVSCCSKLACVINFCL
jgi:hypothetical protein